MGPEFDCGFGLNFIEQDGEETERERCLEAPVLDLCFHHTCSFQHTESTAVCCHAWPFLSVWAGNIRGEGRRTHRGGGGGAVRGCNAGRSFITLCLTFAVVAPEIAHGSGKVHRFWNWRPIYLKRRQRESKTESKNMHYSPVCGERKEKVGREKRVYVLRASGLVLKVQY